MQIREKEITLKDGRKGIIRSPRAEDAEETIDFLTVTRSETDFLLRYPEECSARYTVESEVAFFERINSSENEAMLMCFVDGKLAAMSNLSWMDAIKVRHRANVSISVKKDCWNLGIGSQMFAEMIRICEEDGKILQMELDFIEGNTRARALYEKMGFRIAGIKPNAIRLKDGTLLNEYSMVRTVK